MGEAKNTSGNQQKRKGDVQIGGKGQFSAFERVIQRERGGACCLHCYLCSSEQCLKEN